MTLAPMAVTFHELELRQHSYLFSTEVGIVICFKVNYLFQIHRTPGKQPLRSRDLRFLLIDASFQDGHSVAFGH